MANRLAGDVVVEAGGETFVLRFRMNEILSALHELGIADASISISLLRWIEAAERFAGRRVIFHEALKGGGMPGITIERAGEILTEVGWLQSTKAITAGLMAAYPEKKTGKWWLPYLATKASTPGSDSG